MQRPTNPLNPRERRMVKANAELGEKCPNPDCNLSPDVADVTQDGTLYVTHEEDGVGLDSNSPRGETDGCRVDPDNDPTL